MLQSLSSILFSVTFLPMHPEGESCSDIGLVLILIDPAAVTFLPITLKASHSQISVECSFSLTLLQGRPQARGNRGRY
jgi:hypothetical protein